jgi:hypothetical protein
MALGPLRNFLGFSGAIDKKPVAPLREMGVSNVQVFGGFLATAERARQLQGQEKFRTYNDIVSNCSIVAASIRFYSNVLTNSEWKVNAPDDSAAAQQYADFVEDVMYGMESSWDRIIRRAAGFKFSGCSVNEWTARRTENGQIVYRNIEARAPGTITQWDLDEQGNVQGFVQRDPNTQEEVYLPRAKTIYLVDDMLSDQPDGLGLLRHCAEPAERLKAYQILEQRGYERDLRGIPIGHAPYAELADWAGDDPERLARAQQHTSAIENFVSMQVKGESTGVVLDSRTYTSQSDTGNSVTGQRQWDLSLLQGGANGLSDMAAAVTRLNTEMARVLGCEMLLLGETASSQALSKDKSGNLFLSVNSTLKDLTSQFDKDFIDPLWEMNGFPDEYKPYFSTEDVAKRTAEDIAETLANLARAALQPDDEATDYVRGMLGVPNQPESTLAVTEV